MTTTAIIDGDIFIYSAASSAERIYDWDEELWSICADLNEAKGHYSAQVARTLDYLGADRAVVCVSDKHNFRKDLWPLYKANRKNRKPLVFGALRDWVVDELGGVRLPGLEGDDVMGIMATSPDVYPDGKKIIVTIDKDLKCVPGFHWNPDKADAGIRTVSVEEARQWHLQQSISGDHTDGYSGVPGVGPKKSLEMLMKKGFTWNTVVEAYKKAGLTEAEALLNARMAKILLWPDWDPVQQKPILWSPEAVSV